MTLDRETSSWPDALSWSTRPSMQRLRGEVWSGAHATMALLALTPPPGRGKRQYGDEAALRQAADALLKTHRVEGSLHYQFVRHEQRTLRYVGRGRWR